mgnify:CR=1 FL=1
MSKKVRSCKIGCIAVLAALLAVAMLSCGSVQSRASGTPEVAKLELVGGKVSSVKVSIDGAEPFTANVNKEGKHSHQYSIPSGSHEIVVRRGNEVLLSKTIYSSVGEVKVVVLP